MFALLIVSPEVSSGSTRNTDSRTWQTIMSCFDDQRRTTKELALTCSDMSMREFKAEITTIISNGMADVRNKYNRLMHPDHAVYLHEIAATGRDKARLRAMRTMDVVRQALRLGIPALPNH